MSISVHKHKPNKCILSCYQFFFLLSASILVAISGISRICVYHFPIPFFLLGWGLMRHFVLKLFNICANFNVCVNKQYYGYLFYQCSTLNLKHLPKLISQPNERNRRFFFLLPIAWLKLSFFHFIITTKTVISDPKMVSFLIINSSFFQSLCIQFQIPLIICYTVFFSFVLLLFFCFVKFTCYNNHWMQIMWNIFHSWQAQLSHIFFLLLLFYCLSILMKSSTKAHMWT